MGDITSDLRSQGVAILIMVGIAILSVLGMIILAEFQDAVPVSNAVTSAAVNTTIAAFIAGFAIVGTFATVTMLIIVVKAIIGVVKGLQQ